MATMLLIVIYMAFIGLGIPDSLFGTAWPAIYTEFQLPISFGSFVTVLISFGTILSSLVSNRLIHRLGTNRVSAFSTLLTALALLGFSFAPNLGTMCALSIFLGLGAGAIDVALNNYVALHYSATHMSFLHCFYGVGVAVSPYILSLVIQGEAGWRGGYRIAFLLQLAITAVLFCTLPLWNKAHGGTQQAEQHSEKTLSFAESMRIPGVKLMCGLFIFSCAIECTCGGWGSTFLVEARQMSTDKAAQVIMLYYVGMAIGRLWSGLVASRLHSWKIIGIGQIVLGVGLGLLLIPGSAAISAAGLFLIGLGNGPLFPNFNYLTPENFGADVSQSVIGVQMSSAYVGIMLAPMLGGVLGQTLGMEIFPVYLLLFYGLMIPATAAVKRTVKTRRGHI